MLICKPKVRRTLENPGIDGRIMIRWILENLLWMDSTDTVYLQEFFQRGNEKKSRLMFYRKRNY
jgi:hypothetical protein